MLLNGPQKFLKGMLRDFGALRRNQVELLLKMQNPYFSYDQTVVSMIHNGLAREVGDYLTTLNGNISLENIIAIDIMLRIESEKIDVIQKGAPPFKVTFFKKKNEKLWRYDVCVVEAGKEMFITSALESINPKYRTIIFVLENPEQQENIIVPCDYCFAWKKNGEYHFYKESR